VSENIGVPQNLDILSIFPRFSLAADPNYPSDSVSFSIVVFEFPAIFPPFSPLKSNIAGYEMMQRLVDNAIAVTKE
jgi:hypothetical protein